MNVPRFKIEDIELPIMLCGSAPFIGLGYFGFSAFNYRVKFYNHPDTMADIFAHFVRQGCKGAHVLCYDNIIKAAKIAYDVETFPVMASLVSAKNTASQLKALSRLETVLIFIDPSQSDALNESALRDTVKSIRDAGIVAGLATYTPGITIPEIDTMGLDIAAYLLPVNKEGKYMQPTKEKTLQAIAHTDKKVVAMKPLAIGKIPPREGFPFVLDHCDGFCVGFTSKEQIDEAYQVLTQITR
ncbi:MAG: hypothetical protein HXS40_05525 [Theionarchaea archaeon]|nr:hypothetical protein [Theionarchaea archaeon]